METKTKRWWQEMSEELQKVTFEPDPKQIKFAEIYLDHNKKKTKEEMAEEIGVTRMTLWRWFQNEGFIEWINSKTDELLNKSLVARYKTAVRKAEAGDFQFSKLLLEMQGKYTPRSENKVTNIETKDGLEDLSEEDLIKGFKKDLEIYENNLKKKK